MAQTIGVSTTTYALDVGVGLPEVVYTSDDNTYLHLPGLIATESATGTARYLLSDGLGSVRQAVDASTEVVAYKEFDSYGNPIVNSPLSLIHYGFTGEWWEDEVGLLYLRARWYAPESGTFLSRDSVESEPPYQYVGGRVVNLTDPLGFFGCDSITGQCDYAEILILIEKTCQVWLKQVISSRGWRVKLHSLEKLA